MSKEQFEEYLRTNRFNKVAYQYWLEFKKPGYATLTEHEFETNFSRFISLFNGGFQPDFQKIVDLGLIQKKVIEYFKNKFQ